MADVNTGLPGTPSAPIADEKGDVTPVWYQFFLNLWTRTGGASGTVTVILDNISSTVGAMLVRGGEVWEGLNPGQKNLVLKMGDDLPGWDVLDGDSFVPVSANKVFTGPSNGASIEPTFRSLVAADLPAADFLESEVALPGIALVSATPADITSINIPAGKVYDVWGAVVTNPNGATTTSKIQGWISTVSATDPGPPNKGAYAQLQTTIAAGLGQALPVGRIRIAEPATAFLSMEATFAVNAMAGYGYIGAVEVL